MSEANFLFATYDCDAVVSQSYVVPRWSRLVDGLRAVESQCNPGGIHARRRYVECGRDSVWRAE